MSYKIWICCDDYGVPYVGAKYRQTLIAQGRLADSVRVFGSQIPCRCVARLPTGEYLICTPTFANKNELPIYGRF